MLDSNYEGLGLTQSIFDETEDHLLNCFFIKADRHDKDRVEFQFGFDGIADPHSKQFSYDVDFVLFVPKTLGLNEVESVSHLRNEFQSYVRLHTHLSNPKNEPNLQIIKEHLQQLRDLPSRERLRILAIDFDSFVKTQTRKVRKEIAKLKISYEANLSVDNCSQFLHDLSVVAELMDTYRAFLHERHLSGRHCTDFAKTSLDHDLLLFNEYISHIYVQRLAELFNSAKQLQSAAAPVLDHLKKSALAEAQIRSSYGLHVEDPQDEEAPWGDENLYLRRISLLKKYFQKSLFIHVSGESTENKLFIPVYSLAAAIAAAFAIMVQLYQVTNIQERIGINSVALITIGIVAYVIKDIMKDSLRKFLFKSGARWLADFEKKLFLHRADKNKEEQIGLIKEWVASFDAVKLRDDLKEARYNILGGELEEALNEDILHFKKRVTLQVNELTSKEDSVPWGLREIVRYRFDRFLISMEDAYKKMHLVTADGNFRTRYGHRVYQIYAATWIQISPTEGAKIAQPVFRAFRITLDKTGVISCEGLDWLREGKIPSVPY